MKKKKILPIILLVLVVSIIGSTFAWFFSSDTVINAFKTEEAKISITPEEPGFENDKEWDGEAKSKVVKIKNDNDKSNVDVLIRVNLTPRWVDEEGNPFAGDINLIELVYDQVSDSLDIENKWIYGNDGYYYYKAKVSPGSSTEALLKEVKAKGEIPDSYSGKDFIVDVNAEAVVADKESFKTIWNITDTNSNIYNLLSNIVNN